MYIMGFTKEQRDVTTKYYYKTHPLHYYNRGIIFGSKILPYYKNEMMYGSLNLKYDINDFSVQEVYIYKKVY